MIIIAPYRLLYIILYKQKKADLENPPPCRSNGSIECLYLLFQVLHRSRNGGFFGRNLENSGIKVYRHRLGGQFSGCDIDGIHYIFLGSFNAFPHLGRNINLLRHVVFVLASDGGEQHRLHLGSRQLGVVHTKKQLVRFDSFQEKGHPFVRLKANRSSDAFRLELQFQHPLFLVVFNEVFDDEKGCHSHNHGGQNGDEDYCNCIHIRYLKVPKIATAKRWKRKVNSE